MPFITLNDNWTRLASLYNQAFRNKPEIPASSDLYTTSDDGLIRGGLKNALLATKQDLNRVGKFFQVPLKGLNSKESLFFTKQVLLYQANPRLERNKDLGTVGNLLSGTLNVLGGPTRLFTGLGSLASVGGNAFGLHFDSIGLLPPGIVPANQKYGGTTDNPLLGVAYSNNFNSTNRTINKDSQNRLLEYTYKISNPKKEDKGTVVLDSYLGGPNAVYGIVGRTRTKSYYDRTTIRTNDILNSNLALLLNGFIPLTSEQISNIPNSDREVTTSIPIPTISGSNGYYRTNTYNAPGYSLESKYGVSTNSGPGSTNHKIDSINSINVVGSKVFYGNIGKKSNEVSDAITSASFTDGDFGTDLIKFRIEFLNNETTTVDIDGNLELNTDVLAFRAYIDDFNDGMQAKWSSYKYMGRGEEFYVYDGFTRDISISFTIHAHSPEEMAPLYSKLNYLMSAFAPDYSSQFKMRGNIAYLTVGDYLFRQPGIFTDIKLSGFLDSHWETAVLVDGKNNTTQYEVPKNLKVGLSFKPIHTFLPRRNYSSKDASGKVQQEFPASFITPDRQTYPSRKSDNEVDYSNKYLNTGGWKS